MPIAKSFAPVAVVIPAYRVVDQILAVLADRDVDIRVVVDRFLAGAVLGCPGRGGRDGQKPVDGLHQATRRRVYFPPRQVHVRRHLDQDLAEDTSFGLDESASSKTLLLLRNMKSIQEAARKM